MNYNVRIDDNFLRGDHVDGEVLQHTDLNELENVIKTAINANYEDIQKLQDGTMVIGNSEKLNGATLSKLVDEPLQNSDAKVPTSMQVKEYVDTIFETIDLSGYATERELQEGLDLLQNYIDTYFDNLDVQEEINNKLDEMVEDGTFESILVNITNLNKTYENYNEFINDTTLIKGNNVKILSYDEIGDGIAEFTITDTQDNNHYQIPVNNLYATCINKEINAKYLNPTNDDLTTTLNANSKYFDKIIFTKNYKISGNIILTTNIHLDFMNNTLTCENENTKYISLLNNSIVENLNTVNVGIDVYGSNNIIKNIKVTNTTTSSFYINVGKSVQHTNNKFINCVSSYSYGMGYQIARNTNLTERNEGMTGAIIDNLIYENCKAEYSGQTENTVTGTWSTGFCIENAGAINKTITYINCEASYSAESGFHCEYNTIPENLVYINCYSHDNGLLKSPATYGCSFLFAQQGTYINCISKNNSTMAEACINDMLRPLNKLNNIDIKEIDETNKRIKSISNMFVNADWIGRDYVITTVPLTNLVSANKLRIGFYNKRRDINRLEDYISFDNTTGEISFLETDKTKYAIGLNIIELNPLKNINISMDAKAKVYTEGLNNNFCYFLIGYDDNLNATRVITSGYLNGITTSDYTTLTKTNVSLNSNEKYAVLVLMPNYGNYTYQAPYIKNIKVYQS